MTGLPSLLLMWLIHLRQEQRRLLIAGFRLGRAMTLCVLIIQLVQTVYHVYLDHGAFQWANALTLLILLWFGFYLIRSRRVKACFDSTGPLS
ncbi:DUF2919 family protein [Vibrio metschnikovii]